MVNCDLNYETIALVIESWEELRRIPNYEEVAGSVLFLRFFEKCPKAKVLFGYPADMAFDSNEIKTSRRFLMHASYMIQMIDTAINMLGPDSELLSEIMEDLGHKHKTYGVSSDMFPLMGEALLFTLKQTLGSKFGEKEFEAVRETYRELAGDMTKGHRC